MALFKRKETNSKNVEDKDTNEVKPVYFFGELGKEGKNLLGGKGANLSEMKKIGVPVPNGFTITTKECLDYYEHGEKIEDYLVDEITDSVYKLEELTGKKFGDIKNPLLVSVRSGAKISMPGMMDTVLNLGLNDKVVEGLAKLTGNRRFALDAYRRFLQMFGDVVVDISKEEFEEELTKLKEEKKVELDTQLTEKDLEELIKKFKKVFTNHNINFPEDPFKQLFMAIEAVFASWNNERAIYYRKANSIPHNLGTAVNIVEMVFGNMGDDSGTGVAFTRNPNTGEKKIFGEILENAQGEDVVAGIRTPKDFKDLEKINPKVYKELLEVFTLLENHFKDMQDVEFTIEKNKLFVLQTRNGKRTSQAALKIAVNLVDEKILTQKEALLKVEPNQIENVLHKKVDPKSKEHILAKGLAASPGAAVGKVVFNAEDAELSQEPVILVRPETSPEDIKGMAKAQGILTSRGGMTSHAAVVARGMGKCAITGCEQLKVNLEKKEAKTSSGVIINQGDWLTLDGHSGEVMQGKCNLIDPNLSNEFEKIMSWARKYKELGVRTNADTPNDAKKALEFGAEGIGLCRTEHMFFEGDRISSVREMILAEDESTRRKALKKILPFQREDFMGIFEAMNGKPVTIRLLDPPLHEFLPSIDQEDEIESLASELSKTSDEIKARIEELHELNPMLGHRGCRLAITYPEIYGMQVQAIFEAAISLKKEGIDVIPEVMIPLVGIEKELQILRNKVDAIVQSMLKDYNVKIDYKIGTMIETPRAALCSEKIVKHADFFSFGTNDLTQMTYGFSRDDTGKLIQTYLDKDVLEEDPFKTLDQEGVGKLIDIAVSNARDVKPNLKCGICGEHGGDARSISFAQNVGLNYVSCSPFRIPVAILSAARAKIEEEN